MTRRLSAEERDLWNALRRAVRPLRPMPAGPGLPAEAPVAAPATEAKAQSKAHAAAPKPSPVAQPKPPPLVRLEGRVRRRLSRGMLSIDDRIDLHGMRQERAFAELIAFVRRNQARGSGVVLVITGKGRQSGGRGEGDETPGVLRQSVPVWLARPELREVVGGFEEAGRRHGGEGALYVRLRRRRHPGAKEERS